MDWVSRFVVSVHLWSMLLGEVRDRHLHHLSCLASSEKGLPSPFCYCGTAGKQLPQQSFGECVTWPQEANFPRSCSPCGSAGWFMVLPKRRIIWLLVYFPHCNNSHLPLHIFLHGSGPPSDGKVLSFFFFFQNSVSFSPNTTCLVALLSGLAQDRIQSKNNPCPCLAVLRGIESCFFSLSNLSGIAGYKCVCVRL